MNVKYDCKKSIALGGSFGCVSKARGTALMSDSSLHFACALREFYVNGDNFMIIRFMKLGTKYRGRSVLYMTFAVSRARYRA